MKTPFLLIALAASAGAQVYTPPSGAPAPNNVIPADNAPAPRPTDPASPLGEEFPMLDPSAETITIGGVAIPLGDNRLLKARFEKYLSQPPEDGEEAAEYRATIKEILDTISPFHEGGPNLQASAKLLPSAATYPGDANLCMTLVEALYRALLSKRDVKTLGELNASIEEEKQQIIREADWDTSTARNSGNGDSQPLAQDNKNKKGKNEEANTTPGKGTSSLKYVETLRRIAEIELLKKENIVRTEAQTLQTKVQYQVNMVQWFMQRRYEHVLMASRFYSQIWKDGDASLHVDKGSDVSKLFSEALGISPTVSSLDSLANEAIREVDKYIEAFDYLLSRDELHSASQRLLEAYAIGEYLSPVATLPIEKKQRVADYMRDINELFGTLQARDYTRARELTANIKAMAKDFPSSKVDSVIAAYTLASDLSIEEAKAALMSRDSDKAAEKIKTATEIWPTNPKLEEFRTLMNNAGGVVSARNDFDRLLSEGNYREIARRQYEFAPAIQGDATREDAFRQIMENLTRIEAALGKAAEFSRMGQDYGAWEQLAKIREEFKDDPKLGRELELLAPKVADFTLALDKAHQFEQRTPAQTGSALSWYLKAKSIHPQSEQAEEGIKRLLDEILPEEQ
ncbi:MAG: hypothetical protein NWT08_12640 [Akkermansiaceae bacterium]|jgi:hypothetical protein|nr:hypothetical protein [Akkermansiaceae bacterium]MDP4647397.1 hypothetical protein [Akkermansiaceae bacterium]MDP4848003.1 hypothetical protein [Akkermansiaceae bacterium]MDP4898898.1 hypothetical protein [Akkermansiaceae bacterium]MDP4995080.1 hypothetical protein [Akkermansiaceae bacterium]